MLMKLKFGQINKEVSKIGKIASPRIREEDS